MIAARHCSKLFTMTLEPDKSLPIKSDKEIKIVYICFRYVREEDISLSLA